MLLGGIPSCLGSLRAQISSAKVSGSFVFVHKNVDPATACELVRYLREECQSRFLDLSNMGNWPGVSLEIASAVRTSLRATRSLILDGNDVGGSSESLEAWCQAIEEHPGMQSISLRDTELDGEGAMRVARMLLHNSVLFSVDLGLNRIDNGAVSVLMDAVAENCVLLELNVEGTQASRAMCQGLAQLLAQNVKRFSGAGLVSLEHLKKARARALSVSATGRRERDLRTTFQLAPADIQALDAESLDRRAARVDGERITAELWCRCEAEWRYTPAERERLHELRRHIAGLQAARQQERRRTEETRQEIDNADRDCREKVEPMSQSIHQLKQRLAVQIEDTKMVLEKKIKQNVALTESQEALAALHRHLNLEKLNATKAESDLKLRHREVVDDVAKLERELELVERNTDRLATSNECMRKQLHAHRFETEERRFAPADRKSVV